MKIQRKIFQKFLENFAMDYDLPEELAGYLPKQRNGFQAVNQRKQAPSKTAVKKVPSKSPSNLSTKKVPTKPQKNPTATKPPPESSVRNTNPYKTAKPTKTATTMKPSQKVQTVYPNKEGKLLSKVPDEKWKEVRSGPREDPSIVRTKSEEIEIFLNYTNKYRLKNNLNTLEFSEELSQIAEVHNNDMMEGKTAVGHEGFKERCSLIGKKFVRASENCAMYVGPREHLLTLFENLCRSPVHNKNLLGDFDTIGVALGKNEENMWYVTQFFVRFKKS